MPQFVSNLTIKALLLLLANLTACLNPKALKALLLTLWLLATPLLELLLVANKL
jgi:hypothetical protein